jgi:hypothetical protein
MREEMAYEKNNISFSVDTVGFYNASGAKHSKSG